MANNLFSQAKAYCKKHPRTTYRDAIKLLAGKNKKGAKVGKATKKAKPVTVKVTKTKKGNTRLSISGISMNKVQTELTHQRALQQAMDKHKSMLSEKGLNVKEKAAIRKDIAHLRNNISASKKHISVLKRSI